MKKYTEDDLKKLKDETDYGRVKRMTDEEIEENAHSDEDSLSPTEDDFKRFKKARDHEKK